jgi:hypothetical protein
MFRITEKTTKLISTYYFTLTRILNLVRSFFKACQIWKAKGLSTGKVYPDCVFLKNAHGLYLPRSTSFRTGLQQGPILWSLLSAIFAYFTDKSAFFLQTSVMIQFMKNRSALSPKRQFSRHSFRRVCFKIHNIGPWFRLLSISSCGEAKFWESAPIDRSVDGRWKKLANKLVETVLEKD